MRRLAELWVIGLFGWLAWRDWPGSVIGLGVAVGCGLGIFGVVSLMVRALDWNMDREVARGCRSLRR